MSPTDLVTCPACGEVDALRQWHIGSNEVGFCVRCKACFHGFVVPYKPIHVDPAVLEHVRKQAGQCRGAQCSDNPLDCV